MPAADVDTFELDIDVTQLGNDGKPFAVIVHAVIWNGFQGQELSTPEDKTRVWEWASTRIDSETQKACLLIKLPNGKFCTAAQANRNRIGDTVWLRSPVSADDFVDPAEGVIYRSFKSPEPGFVYSLRWQWTDRH